MELTSLLSESLAPDHWYADFKNETTHIVIFPDRVFVIDRSDIEQYREAVRYGQELGIPAYQLDFSPTVRPWGRPADFSQR